MQVDTSPPQITPISFRARAGFWSLCKSVNLRLFLRSSKCNLAFTVQQQKCNLLPKMLLLQIQCVQVCSLHLFC